MARKIKPPDALPSKAWLLSFGDTMTTLLAFFIVLCSMAEDQTGANLHTGTGSFINAIKAAGLPGAFPGNKSDRAVQLKHTNPLYSTTDADAEDDPQKERQGPDQDANDVPSLDREQEQLMRFLNEMERSTQIDAKAKIVGETTFDFFERLNLEPPYLPANYAPITAHIVPLLRRASHRVELIVWASTPSQSARTRASLQSSEVVAALIRQANLSATEAQRILGTGRTWPYHDIQRPVLSLVIHRVEDGG